MDLLKFHRLSLEFSVIKQNPLSVPGYLKKTLPANESNTYPSKDNEQDLNCFLRQISQLFWKT